MKSRFDDYTLRGGLSETYEGEIYTFIHLTTVARSQVPHTHTL